MTTLEDIENTKGLIEEEKEKTKYNEDTPKMTIAVEGSLICIYKDNRVEIIPMDND